MNIAALEAMLQNGKDNALLRFGLGKAYFDEGQASQAVTHLLACTQFDPSYSAAWKLLGKAYLQSHNTAAALDAWTQGLAAAQTKGDKQAEKEMLVLVRRIHKSANNQHG
ncbi:tetratricopeptide repeat protein [Lampropedia aestuarii]|uniref:tetratricopeptide repeat protein n=1 Tax=Lampropedia aestuarii TaxID=2562762 RepID=UPI0024697322|nr:tetratricopeptide repeat protein [Lampropedia aestuarii]MDH5859170.1 tetratricopeptide repeat protein [Lampropedia aestuarii]